MNIAFRTCLNSGARTATRKSCSVLTWIVSQNGRRSLALTEAGAGKVILTNKSLPIGLESLEVGQRTNWKNWRIKNIKKEGCIFEFNSIGHYISGGRFRLYSSNNHGYLQHNCKPTSFRSQIHRTISGSGCGNCRMEIWRKGTRWKMPASLWAPWSWREQISRESLPKYCRCRKIYHCVHVC